MVSPGGVDFVKTRFNIIDRIVLIYNGTIALHILISSRSLPNWPTLFATHAGILAAIWIITGNDRDEKRGFWQWLHVWYPLISLLWFYPETGILRHTIIPRDLDPELLLWETAIFPQRFYFTIPLGLSVPALEFFHAAYFSYYFIVWIPAILAYKRQKVLVKEYVFVLMVTMFVHYWFTIIFPASGPTALREQVMPQGFLFIPIMDFLYATADKGGAAFPSTHSAAAVIAAFYASRFFPEHKWTFLVWLFMILVSTVMCTFHYTIDTISGIVTGIVLLFLGKQLHERLKG